MPKRALIDVDELKLALITGNIDEEEQYCYPCKKVLNTIDQQPIIEERTTGKWEHGRETSRLYQGKELVGIMYEDWHCSECGLAFERSKKPIHNFCPNCGAYMTDDGKEKAIGFFPGVRCQDGGSVL